MSASSSMYVEQGVTMRQLMPATSRPGAHHCSRCSSRSCSGCSPSASTSASPWFSCAGCRTRPTPGSMAGTRVWPVGDHGARATVVYASLANQAVQDRVDRARGAEPAGHPSPTFTYATAVQFRDCVEWRRSATRRRATPRSWPRSAARAWRVRDQRAEQHLLAQGRHPGRLPLVLRRRPRVSDPDRRRAGRRAGRPDHGADDQSRGCGRSRIGPPTPSRRARSNPRICTFWDSNAPPWRDYKETVNMSRYSDLSAPRGSSTGWTTTIAGREHGADPGPGAVAPVRVAGHHLRRRVRLALPSRSSAASPARTASSRSITATTAATSPA